MGDEGLAPSATPIRPAPTARRRARRGHRLEVSLVRHDTAPGVTFAGVHLTVLSRSPAIYTTRRIVEAARARGSRVRVLDPVQVEMKLGVDGPALFYRGGPFPRTDAVIPRVAPSITPYGLAVVN